MRAWLWLVALRFRRVAVVTPIAGGSLSVARAAARALSRLGHEVTLVDNAQFGPTLAAIRASSDPPDLKDGMVNQLGRHAAAQTTAALLRLAPDLALYLAQAPVLRDDDTAPVRERGIRTVFWFVEDRRVFPYWAQTARRFDAFWGIQQDDFAEALRAVGQPCFDFVPTAFDPELHVPASTPPPSAGEVTFVGSPYANRLALLGALAERARFEVRVYGPGWGAEPRLRGHLGHDGELPHEVLPRIFTGSAINLNLSSSGPHADWSERKSFVNPRLFELAGCGAFQLAEALLPVETFFVPGEELALFDGAEQALEACARYLAEPVERARIAAAGRARALAHHTYDVRLAEALARLP